MLTIAEQLQAAHQHKSNVAAEEAQQKAYLERRKKGLLTPRQIALKNAEKKRNKVLKAIKSGCGTIVEIREHLGITYGQARTAVETLTARSKITTDSNDRLVAN